MAYLIYGEEYPVVFLANVRTGSTAVRNALLEAGAEQQGEHHSSPNKVPDCSLIVQTVRHHCDVLVSYWYSKSSGNKFDDFVELVLDGQHPILRPTGFYSHWSTNYILRYETLDYEWENLCLCAGIPYVPLQRTKTKRPKNINWKLMFKPRLYDKVAARYQKEMELYGYGRN